MATTITVTKPDGRVYPGSTIVLTAVVSVDSVATDTPAIAFRWRFDNERIRTVSPVNTATGTYTATITLPDDESGLLNYAWDTGGATDTAQEGSLLVEPGRFAFTRTYDYGATS